jgi:hypothetical protein
MGTGKYFLGVERMGCKITTHLQVVLRTKMVGLYLHPFIHLHLMVLK